MDTCPVTCPSCFEVFEIAAPPLSELPCEIDYDCEVCCRPMFVAFEDDGDGGVSAWARGLGE
jgi:hypothetical protein